MAQRDRTGRISTYQATWEAADAILETVAVVATMTNFVAEVVAMGHNGGHQD